MTDLLRTPAGEPVVVYVLLNAMGELIVESTRGDYIRGLLGRYDGDTMRACHLLPLNEDARTVKRDNLESAEAFHISEYIRDEMEARGLDMDTLAILMGGDWAVTRCTLDLLLHVHRKSAQLGPVAGQLARAFGTTPDLWTRIHETWRHHPRAVETPESTDGGADV